MQWIIPLTVLPGIALIVLSTSNLLISLNIEISLLNKEKDKYQQIAEKLQISLNKLEEQSEKLSELEQQLRLADRLSVVGELTASLAHEVRNPLGAIRGAAEILEDELPKDIKVSEFFQIILQEINTTGRIGYFKPDRSRITM